MKFSIRGSFPSFFFEGTEEEAVSEAAKFVYPPKDTQTRCVKELEEKGRTAWAYGFSEAWIERH